MNDSYRKLDHTLGDIIALLEDEESASENSEDASGNLLLKKFKGWREDLDAIRGARAPSSGARTTKSSPEREGGLFVD